MKTLLGRLVWSTGYHEKLYLRRGIARDFLRYRAPHVVYKNTLTATPCLTRRLCFILPVHRIISQLYVDSVVIQPLLREAYDFTVFNLPLVVSSSH
jgi:hypothetical protein